MIGHEKNRTMESPTCPRAVVTIEGSERKETHTLSSMKDNKFAYRNAFATVKFPLTSGAAKMKYEDQLEEVECQSGGASLTFPPYHDASTLPHPEKPSGRLVEGRRSKRLLTLVDGTGSRVRDERR